VFNSDSANIATVGKITDQKHWQDVFNTLKVPDDKHKEFEDAFWGGDRVDQTLIQFLRELRPGRKTGLLSNAWSNARAMLTDKYKCMDAFDVSVFSFEVGMAKPDPAIYYLILDKMEVQPQEAIFVDDFPENIRAAADLGIHAIQFKGAEQALADIRKLL